MNVSVKLRQRRIPAVYCGRIYLVLFNSVTKAVSVSKKPGETKSVAFFYKRSKNKKEDSVIIIKVICVSKYINHPLSNEIHNGYIHITAYHS